MELPPPKASRSTLSRATHERRAGRDWKAKEILQGAVSNHPTDPRVLEAYGRVLHDLGDRIEAGKYLFLAGAQDDVARSDIELFLERHGRGHPRNLVGQFPAQLRAGRWEALPSSVVEELRAHGVVASTSGIEQVEAPRSKWKAFLETAQFTGAIAFLLFLVLFIVGAIVKWGLRVYDFVMGIWA